MSKWMTQDWTTGQLNALVKNVGEANARAIIAGKAKIEVTILSFLDSTTTVSLPAQPRFIAYDHFKVDTSKEAKVRIAFLWDNFRNHFLDKIEDEVSESELAVRKLSKDLLDEQIRSELGGALKEETTLSQMWALLEKQGHGEKGGVLLVNGYANIFYIRDKDGTLWAVRAYWYADDDGWYVDAYGVGHPYGWRADYQVLSRN